MQELDLRFKALRVNLRKHGVAIADNVFKRHHPIGSDPKDEICIFCNSQSNITREHALPKWILEESLHETMISSVNRQTLTYNKAVVPACAECNNSILAFIEKSMINIISNIERADSYGIQDLYNITRWLEIIDYKLQVIDCRRKYIKHGNSEYDKDWGIFPVAMMRHFLTMSPWKAYDWLRSSQRRIMVKGKTKQINSLVILKPPIPHFYFFTQPNEYIYISFPMFKVAVFCFLKRKYNHYKDAEMEALSIIEKVMETD